MKFTDAHLERLSGEMRRRGGRCLPEVSRWCPRHGGGDNWPPHQHFAPVALTAAAAAWWSHCHVGVGWGHQFWVKDGGCVDEEVTNEDEEWDRSEPVFETMNEPDRREKFLSAVFAVWAGAQRWSTVESWRQGKDSCSCWVNVGGRQTNRGKSESVLSNTGGQRAFGVWFILVLPRCSWLQDK